MGYVREQACPITLGRAFRPRRRRVVVAREVAKSASVPIGITVMRGGGRAVLGMVEAAGARFVRVCLYADTLVWDTGELDHWNAAGLARPRKAPLRRGRGAILGHAQGARGRTRR